MVSLLNHHRSRAACLLLACLALIGTAEASLFKKEGTPAEERANIRKVSDQALAELYKAQPSAKAHIQKAAGYAVFSNFGMKILVAGGGSGRGIVIDNKTKKETFMKMAEVQAGLGFGVKNFRLGPRPKWRARVRAYLPAQCPSCRASGFTSLPTTAWRWS